MSESKQNQPKFDPNQDKYLIINPAVILDSMVTSRVCMEDDLVLRQLEEGIFSILKDGKRIVEHLDKLTAEHGYAMVFDSNRKESQIIHALDDLDVACKREGIKGFPKITAIVVKDREAYQNVRANDLKVAEGHSHGILVAGFSLQSQHETEILHGCSKLLHFSKLEQNSYIVLDNRSSFIDKAIEEGWNIYDINSTSFHKILHDLCQKSAERDNQDIQENLEEHIEEEKNQEVESKIFSTKVDSISSLSKTLDGGSQNSIYLKHEAEQKNLIKMSSDAIVTPTMNNFGSGETSSKTFDCNSQKLFQTNIAMEIGNKKKEEADRNEFSELKNFLPNYLLPSNLIFKVIEGAKPRGSSPSLAWFIDEETNSKWVGKCSPSEILNKDHFVEYKEFLGGLIYKLFGVRIPKTVFSEQLLAKKVQANNFCGASDVDKPRLHIMSNCVPGFELLGDQFLENYKASSKRNKKQPLYIKEGHKPLRGFGRVVAVSMLIRDYDFVGNSGRNIGYILSKDGEYFEILKIDPGESLCLDEDLSGAKVLDNPPSKKEAVAGSLGQRINFDDLNEFDKRECIETLTEILDLKVSTTLEKIFLPFFNIDDRFKLIFEELLNRRKELLAAFYGEVGSLIDRYIRELEEQQAAEQMSKWGKPPSYLPLQREKKDQLVRNKALLEAFTAATNTKILQASSYKKVKFIGRESELSQIKKVFSGNTGITVCAIVGGPGLGKSQLATEYIHRNQQQMYSEIVWLNAEKSDLIADQMQIYLETCYNVKFDSQDKNKKSLITKKFYQILGKEHDDDSMNKNLKKLCVVFDNADSMAEIIEYLPDNKLYTKLKIDIIVTSRYKKWDLPVGELIEMQGFDVEETKNYIAACIPRFGVGQYGDQLVKDAENLNDLIGGLPLALSLAVAYTQQRGISVSGFCDFINQENNKELISIEYQNFSEKDCASEEDEDKSKRMNFILTILTLALADIRSKNYSAEPVLDILAYLSPDQISIAMLKDCWMQYVQKSRNNDHLVEKTQKITQGNGPNRFIQEVRQEFLNIYYNHDKKNQIAEVEGFDIGLDLLLSYSIITVNPIQDQPEDSDSALIQGTKINNIQVHRLTQQVIRLNHQKSDIYDRIYENMFEWIVDRLDYDEKDMKDVQRVAFLMPHAIHLEGLRSCIKDDEMTELQELIGKHQLYGVGNYNVALKYYQKALEIKTKNYGKDHLETGITLTNLGIAWGSLGEYEKSKDLLTQALAINEKHYGKDHPQTGSTLTNLGNVWGSLGDYTKKKDLLTRALAINEKHYGKDHPETGIILTNLGIAWGCLGGYDKQKDLLTRALVIIQKHYGKDHPHTGATLTNLGIAWESLGDYEKQKDLLTRALVINEKHYGKDHPETGITLTNLGRAWGSLGEYEKKKDLLARALVINEKHYSKDHPQTGITLTNLGIAWESLGDYEKQKDLLTRALVINEKHYDKDHPETGMTLTNLGKAWGSLGNYEKSKEFLTRALVINEKHYGKDHPETGMTLTNLGIAWGSLGDYTKKKDLLTQALAINEKHYGKDHPETGIVLTNLGNAWGSLGEYIKKKNFLTRALVINEKHYGKDHPQTGMALTNLGNAWGSLGDYEKQKDLLTRALVIIEKHYGKDHTQTGTTLTNLGNAWGSLGDYEKQKDLLTQALVIKEKYYGKDHPSTGITLTNLGNAWGSLGDYEKQKDLLTQALVIIEKHYGQDHPQTGITLTNLGIAWGSFGEYEKQKDLLTRALVIKEKHYDKDHPQTGSTLTNLGNAWGSLGDYKKKKELLTRALVIKEKHYGKDHPQTGITLINLGNAWGSLGDYTKKKDLLTRALVINEKHYGKDHPQTGITLTNLGNAWGSLGNYEKQKGLLTRALSIFEKHYPRNHPRIHDIKVILTNLNQ